MRVHTRTELTPLLQDSPGVLLILLCVWRFGCVFSTHLSKQGGSTEGVKKQQM